MRLGDWGRWAVTALVGVILVLNGVNLWQQAITPMKSDFRAAAVYIADYHRADYHRAAYRRPDNQSAHQPSGEDYGFTCYLPLVMSDCCDFNELIIFQIPYSKHTFDYYFPEDEYPWAEGIYTNHRSVDGSYLMGERAVADGMQEMTAGRDAVWLIAAETAMWDERELVRAWLDADWKRADEAHFTGVDVYLYVR